MNLGDYFIGFGAGAAIMAVILNAPQMDWKTRYHNLYEQHEQYKKEMESMSHVNYACEEVLNLINNQ